MDISSVRSDTTNAHHDRTYSSRHQRLPSPSCKVLRLWCHATSWSAGDREGDRSYSVRWRLADSGTGADAPGVALTRGNVRQVARVSWRGDHRGAGMRSVYQSS